LLLLLLLLLLFSVLGRRRRSSAQSVLTMIEIVNAYCGHAAGGTAADKDHQLPSWWFRSVMRENTTIIITTG